MHACNGYEIYIPGTGMIYLNSVGMLCAANLSSIKIDFVCTPSHRACCSAEKFCPGPPAKRVDGVCMYTAPVDMLVVKRWTKGMRSRTAKHILKIIFFVISCVLSYVPKGVFLLYLPVQYDFAFAKFDKNPKGNEKKEPCYEQTSIPPPFFTSHLLSPPSFFLSLFAVTQSRGQQSKLSLLLRHSSSCLHKIPFFPRRLASYWLFYR